MVLFHFQSAIPAAVPLLFDHLFRHGYLAVDFFFELSGYVIALNYAAHFSVWTLAANRRFLGLRIARIYPLHLCMLVVFIVNPIAIVVFSRQGTLGSGYNLDYFLLSLVLMQNWGFTTQLDWNVPAWSISTEWFAYLLFPALAWISSRWLRGPARAALAAVTLLVALAAVCLFNGTTLGGEIPRLGLVRCVIEFAIGISLFQFRAYLPRAGFGDAAGLLATLCFVAFAVFSMPDYALMPLGFAALIIASTDEESVLARLLGNRQLEWLGLISYSTYLVHYFVKGWVKFLLVRPGMPWEVPLFAYLSVTAVASVFLYRWIEVPGRRKLRDVLARRPLSKTA